MRLYCLADDWLLQRLGGDTCMLRLDVREARLQLSCLRERISDLCQTLFGFSPDCDDHLPGRLHHLGREHDRRSLS